MLNRFRKQKTRRKQTAEPKRVLLRQILIGFLLAAFFGVLGTGIWYGSRVESLTIDSVEVVGGETITHESVLEIAEGELMGEYYRLVPKRFAWTYPRMKITDNILSIDRVKNVSIERLSGTKLVIVFEEYQPQALWCATLEDTECLFMDRHGYAFAIAPKLEGAAFLRFSGGAQVPATGTVGYDKELLETAEAFVYAAYEEVDLNVIQVEVTAEDEVTYHIAGGGTIKKSHRMSVEETIENLQTILFSEEFAHIEPGNFKYIDLRYGNRVFVNEEVEDVVATSTATST